MTAPVILDASGVPISQSQRGGMSVGAYGDTKHKGASMGRELRRWYPGNGSADADILPDLDILTARARDLMRNDPAAIAPVMSAQHAIVGTGLTFQPAPNWRALGRDQAWADKFADTTHAVVSPWFGTNECDASRYGNFDRLTHQVIVAMMMNGGIIGLPVWDPESGLGDWGTAMHMIEIDRLRNPNNLMDTTALAGGIETNDWGRPLAYHLMTRHPGDAGQIGYEETWERIPATTDWVVRPRVIHVYDKQRTGQRRGISMLAPIMPQLHMLGRSDQAELESQLANAMIAFFAQMQLPPEAIMELFDGDVDGLMDLRTERSLEFGGRRREGQPSSAKVIPLLPGEEVKAHVSERPNANWGPFSESILRRAYSALGQSYEIGSKNLGTLNYSGARSAALETWRTWATQRVWLTDQWCKPCYRLAFEEAVNRGKIPDCTPEDLYSNFDAWTNSTWNGPGKGWVDPVKEAEGAGLRVTNLISNLKKECADQGEDWRDVLRQQKTERDFCEELGIPYVAAAHMVQQGLKGRGRTVEDDRN